MPRSRPSTHGRKPGLQKLVNDYWKQFLKQYKKWWHRRFWHKLVIIISVFVFVCISCMYGLAQWYILKHKDEPLHIGATFIPAYARKLGVEPKETLSAIINDLGVRHLRLVSYWEDIEVRPGVYNFDELDWQFEYANANDVDVSLAIGLRQPRWPECHMPTWMAEQPKSVWQPELYKFIEAVVRRYRDNPALDSYQLENEYFLKVFGICPDFSRDRLVEEFNLVKSLDPHHTLVVSMSNNAIGTPIGEPTPDKWAISIYKRVWDKTLTKRYYEYPIPAWYYAFRAGWTELTRGHDSFIHELQAEAWMPDGYSIESAPIEELYKSMNPDRLYHRFHYGVGTGMRKVDLWGVEWWYQMKVVRGHPELWDTAKTEFARFNN